MNNLCVGGAQKLVLDTVNALATEDSMEVALITIVKPGEYVEQLDPRVEGLHLVSSDYKSPWGLLDIIICTFAVFSG